MKRLSVIFFMLVVSMSMAGCRAVTRYGDDVVRNLEKGFRVKDLIELILGKDDKEDDSASTQIPTQAAPTAIKGIGLQHSLKYPDAIPAMPQFNKSELKVPTLPKVSPVSKVSPVLKVPTLPNVSPVSKVPVKCVYCNGTGKRGAVRCTHCHGFGTVL